MTEKHGATEGDTEVRGVREYSEIVFCMLSACLNGALKSHVADHCNLNSRQLDRYVGLLLTNGLLEHAVGRRRDSVDWRTTTKGRRYLEIYYSLDTLLRGGRDRERQV